MLTNPYKNLVHALHTLYTQFSFVLHSFYALVNHIIHYVQNVRCKQNIGHMCKMCTGGIHMQYMWRRYTYAICVQFAHNPQDVCKICAVCAHKKKEKKSSAPVARRPSKHWAGPMFENWCFQCGMVSDTYSYSRRPFICAATLPKVSVLIVCNGNSSMSWVKRSGSFKYN